MGNCEMEQHETHESCAEVAFSAIVPPLVDEAIERANTIVAEPSADGLHQLRITMRRVRSL